MDKLAKITDVVAVFNYKGLKLKSNQTAPIHIKIYRGGRIGQRMRRIVPTGVEIVMKDWES